MKLEDPEYDDNEIELKEYLDNTADDEIFLNEPYAVVDDIMEFEFAKVENRVENPINDDTPIIVVEKIIPAIENYTKTIVETTKEKNFDCKMCDKGRYKNTIQI